MEKQRTLVWMGRRAEVQHEGPFQLLHWDFCVSTAPPQPQEPPRPGSVSGRRQQQHRSGSCARGGERSSGCGQSFGRRRGISETSRTWICRQSCPGRAVLLLLKRFHNVESEGGAGLFLCLLVCCHSGGQWSRAGAGDARGTRHGQLPGRHLGTKAQGEEVMAKILPAFRAALYCPSTWLL